jgi:hypothetical protein
MKSIFTCILLYLLVFVLLEHLSQYFSYNLLSNDVDDATFISKLWTTSYSFNRTHGLTMAYDISYFIKYIMYNNLYYLAL